MKFELASTRNIDRFMDAVKALEGRLADTEKMGLGLVYGEPGLGKTLAMEVYHARSKKAGRIRTVMVRALDIWTQSSMLKDILGALGCAPLAYRKDIMFDQIRDELRGKPAIFLIDEIDKIAGSRSMLGILKDIHDVTGSSILMIGEERVNDLLTRFHSFYNRMNRSAVVKLKDHTQEDVGRVIEQRCEVPVETAVVRAIHQEVGGKSMRSVLDRISDMEQFSQTNCLKAITLGDYNQLPEVVNG